MVFFLNYSYRCIETKLTSLLIHPSILSVHSFHLFAFADTLLILVPRDDCHNFFSTPLPGVSLLFFSFFLYFNVSMVVNNKPIHFYLLSFFQSLSSSCSNIPFDCLSSIHRKLDGRKNDVHFVQFYFLWITLFLLLPFILVNVHI